MTSKKIKWRATIEYETIKCKLGYKQCIRCWCMNYVLDEDDKDIFSHPGIDLFYCKLEN